MNKVSGQKFVRRSVNIVYVRASVQGERVSLTSGLKFALSYKKIFIGRVTLSPGSTLPALLTCFVMRDILCNGPKFEILLKFSMETR